jgi:hypothetical protein
MNNKILCFNWNTTRIPLCENYLDNKIENLINRPRGIFTKTTPCYNPLFFDEIEKEIIRFLPSLQILVFLTEGDLENGTWFHSDFLPDRLANLNIQSTPGNQNTFKFRLLTRDKYSGQPNNKVDTVIRMSIYVPFNNKDIRAVELNKGYLFNDNNLHCNYYSDIDYNLEYNEDARALVLYVQSSMGKIAFVGIQYLENTPDPGRVCIKQLENKFINNKGLNHVFILGDFSNNPGIPHDKSYEFIKISDQFYDEYREESRPTGYVDYRDSDKNSEIDYLPSYVDDAKGTIGYHDRILNKSITPPTNQIKCIEYKLIKGSPINNTIPHHFGILGIYEVPNAK